MNRPDGTHLSVIMFSLESYCPVHCPTYASPFSGFLLCRRDHGGPVVAYCGAISPPISDSKTLHRMLEAYSPQSSIGWKSS